jgi:hypothetical protein
MIVPKVVIGRLEGGQQFVKEIPRGDLDHIHQILFLATKTHRPVGNERVEPRNFPRGGFEFFVQASEPLVGRALTLIAGDLVDPEVNIEVFEVVFLQPAVEHRPDDLCGGACRVVTQNAHFDLIALGVGGTDDEAAVNTGFFLLVPRMDGRRGKDSIRHGSGASSRSLQSDSLPPSRRRKSQATQSAPLQTHSGVRSEF